MQDKPKHQLTCQVNSKTKNPSECAASTRWGFPLFS